MIRLRYVGVAAAALLLFGECALAGPQADASVTAPSSVTAPVSGGPGTTQQPGPYYDNGDLVGICVGTGPGGITYVEIHTNFGTASSPNPNALGNCLRGDTQLIVQATVPAFDVTLTPAPSASASGGL